MANIKVEVISNEQLPLIKGGLWIYIDGKWIWVEKTPEKPEEPGVI